jgi:flagellar hook assembly protein FlgD
VAIEVFDLLGRRVRSLTKREWQAGYYSLTWDGRDGSGRRVTPGVYLYRMLAGEFHESRKMVVTP